MQWREIEATTHPRPITVRTGAKINTSRNACLERSFPNLKAKWQELVILAKYLKDSRIFRRRLPVLLFLTPCRFHLDWLTLSSDLRVCRFVVSLWFTGLEDEEWGKGAPQPRVKPQLMCYRRSHGPFHSTGGGFLEALLTPCNNTPQPLLQNVPGTFNTHIFLLRLVLSVEKREN